MSVHAFVRIISCVYMPLCVCVCVWVKRAVAYV